MPGTIMEPPVSVQNSPLLRQLASSNTKTRKEALEALTAFLNRTTPFEAIEMLKMWKGLFYTMWMCDKPRNQQQLAIELAHLVETAVADTNVLPFLDAFWQTMAREWSGIDALRMDKFLFLIRQYLAASFRFIARPSLTWSQSDVIAGFIGILSTTPLNPDDHRIPNGLRYHVLDIFVDELDKVDRKMVGGVETRSGNIPMDQILRPIKILQQSCPTKSIRQRSAEVLADSRLVSWDDLDRDEEKP